jgi:periplasmic copper chaperone A
MRKATHSGYAARRLSSSIAGDIRLKCALAAIALSLGLLACESEGGVTVEQAEFRPPLGASGIGAAYFTIHSDRDDRIVSVSSPLADSVEIHATVTSGNSVSMQRLDSVDLPAGKTIAFETGGMHLMVFSPHATDPGAAFPITIELQSGAKHEARFRQIAGGEGSSS